MQRLVRIFAAAVLLFAANAFAAYPERPITLIVPWGAGGGTDATARIIGTLLEKELGQPVNVVNRTGGSGVVGHAAIASAAPDGYTIGMITVEIGMMHWVGLTQLNGTSYTPIGIVNADPAGVQVRADAPYKDVNDLVKAIKANPGKFKASGTGQGGIWQLAIAGMLRDLKVDPASVSGSSVCKSYLDASSCINALLGPGGVASSCASGPTPLDAAKGLAKVFCL